MDGRLMNQKKIKLALKSLDLIEERIRLIVGKLGRLRKSLILRGLYGLRLEDVHCFSGVDGVFNKCVMHGGEIIHLDPPLGDWVHGDGKVPESIRNFYLEGSGKPKIAGKMSK